MRALVACSLAATSIGCSAKERAPQTPQVIFSTAAGEVPVAVEVMRTDQERARGMMFRKQLDPYAGMLFVFPRTARHSFWMKNTLISLDIIFISERGEVVGIAADAPPMTLDSQRVGTPSRFVVEVNAGFAARHGIEIGTRVTLPER